MNNMGRGVEGCCLVRQLPNTQVINGPHFHVVVRHAEALVCSKCVGVGVWAGLQACGLAPDLGHCHK